jgi:hypothetical protein
MILGGQWRIRTSAGFRRLIYSQFRLTTPATAQAIAYHARPRCAFRPRPFPNSATVLSGALSEAKRRSRRGDLNPEPTVYKTVALPLSYIGLSRCHSFNAH